MFLPHQKKNIIFCVYKYFIRHFLQHCWMVEEKYFLWNFHKFLNVSEIFPLFLMSWTTLFFSANRFHYNFHIVCKISVWSENKLQVELFGVIFCCRGHASCWFRERCRLVLISLGMSWSCLIKFMRALREFLKNNLEISLLQI